MGKRQVRVIRVPRSASWAALALVTILMTLLVYLLSGKAYAGDTHPIREMLFRVFVRRGPMSRDAILVFLMPVFANVLLFVPWGFFAFIALDAPVRARRTTYLIAVGAALMFAMAMYAWQSFLPTRVTSLLDAISNGSGALAGAALAHARKSVYVRFET